MPRLRFKDEAEQDFPEWKEKLLGNLCSTFKSGTGITSEQINTKVSELKSTNKPLINKERSALKGYNNG